MIAPPLLRQAGIGQQGPAVPRSTSISRRRSKGRPPCNQTFAVERQEALYVLQRQRPSVGSAGWERRAKSSSFLLSFSSSRRAARRPRVRLRMLPTSLSRLLRHGGQIDHRGCRRELHLSFSSVSSVSPLVELVFRSLSTVRRNS